MDDSKPPKMEDMEWDPHNLMKGGSKLGKGHIEKRLAERRARQQADGPRNMVLKLPEGTTGPVTIKDAQEQFSFNGKPFLDHMKVRPWTSCDSAPRLPCPVICKRDPENSPEYSAFLYLIGNHRFAPNRLRSCHVPLQSSPTNTSTARFFSACLALWGVCSGASLSRAATASIDHAVATMHRTALQKLPRSTLRTPLELRCHVTRPARHPTRCMHAGDVPADQPGHA